MTTCIAKPGGPSPGAHLRIVRGSCHVYVAFDLGHGIDLASAGGTLESGARPVPDAQSPGERPPSIDPFRTPLAHRFHPEPLRTDLTLGKSPMLVGGRAAESTVGATLFDFGALSLRFTLPIDGASLDDLATLSAQLYESPVLLESARSCAESLIQRLGEAVSRPGLSKVVEDYIVFHAEEWTIGDEKHAPAESILQFASQLTRVLRAATEDVSVQEINDALAWQISYSPRDVVIVDWNAAAVFDDSADALRVLEYANVELLEMRFLDDRLDGVLESAYAWFARPSSPRRVLRGNADARRRLAIMQMDSALLFEGINNAIKLVGDQYLARLYRMAARRFHLDEWDGAVIRKLETVQNVYQKLADEQATLRMEVLEWIIIALIAVSLVLPFIVDGAK